MAHMMIADRHIGPDHQPYMICELSANHNGDFDKAMDLIRAAHATGTDAIKIQTYTADTITLKSDRDDYKIKGGLWDGRTLHDLYQEAYTPWDWHKPMFDLARDLGVTMFSSPFDFTAVDLLEDLNAPAYKIASFEAVDLPLIRYVASTGKPMIISTGMADQDEIAEAIAAARDGGNTQLAILHCVSGYPAPAADYNLRTIADMSDRFGVVTGLSDHTLDNTTAITSIAMGASIIEKHFTLDRTGGGPDDSFSLEPNEFKALCDNSRTAWGAIGQVDYGRKSSEISNVTFRRSLVVAADVAAGDTLTAENIRSLRPGFGLAPKYYEQVIGQKAARDLEFGQPLGADDVDGFDPNP